jgi:hypothetical protein
MYLTVCFQHLYSKFITGVTVSFAVFEKVDEHVESSLEFLVSQVEEAFNSLCFPANLALLFLKSLIVVSSVSCNRDRHFDRISYLLVKSFSIDDLEDDLSGVLRKVGEIDTRLCLCFSASLLEFVSAEDLSPLVLEDMMLLFISCLRASTCVEFGIKILCSSVKLFQEMTSFSTELQELTSEFSVVLSDILSEKGEGIETSQLENLLLQCDNISVFLSADSLQKLRFALGLTSKESGSRKRYSSSRDELDLESPTSPKRARISSVLDRTQILLADLEALSADANLCEQKDLLELLSTTQQIRRVLVDIDSRALELLRPERD